MGISVRSKGQWSEGGREGEQEWLLSSGEEIGERVHREEQRVKGTRNSHAFMITV